MSHNPDDFPIWRPQIRLLQRVMRSSDVKRKKKYLRNTADSFIKRKDVRDYIFQHKGTSCYICGSQATQIDHKISVYRFATENLDIRDMNSYDNLFPICMMCNSSKLP